MNTNANKNVEQFDGRDLLATWEVIPLKQRVKQTTGARQDTHGLIYEADIEAVASTIAREDGCTKDEAYHALREFGYAFALRPCDDGHLRIEGKEVILHVLR
ncbi:hypothetical protein SAMN04487950_4046 [Halogranum rubrum]|uniref:Uncharacterized protein n=1 Tax=Halogranum rubrum TaxID=553466 RepID=A0A1I4IA49_9EURY|nr:hypothetical protein [Halogranum rubrum]SFL50641.1 hypothetical protein SAMN04487950_4046 [Halogranum rubrum]